MRRERLPLDEVLGSAATDKRLDILRRLGEAGSISQAARAAGVSYKAAWQAIETLTNLAGMPLVAKAVGGRGGGGALLTPAGRQVLQAAARLEAARRHALAGIDVGGRAALALRTSMRNQFPCTVAAVRRQPQGVHVALRLAGGDGLAARVTRDSAQLLALAEGLELLALCKATAVTVAARLPPAAGRNLLAGVVNRASRAAGGGEVALRLAGGIQLVGFAAAGHGLGVGSAAMAAIDEAAVVLALA